MEIRFPNFLTMILRRLIHPPLGSMGIGILVRTRTSPAPEEVFTFVRALLAGGMFHVADLIGEMLCPDFGVLGELVVPFKGLEAFLFAAIVLDVEALLLITG
jgi:hypothetical protein